MTRNIYRRAEGVGIQEMDGDLFLADDEGGSIYHLNATGAAFWRALAEPNDLETVVELFVLAFPDMCRAGIVDDLARLLEEMEALGLVVREEA